MIRSAQRQDVPAVGVLWNDMITQTTATFTTEPKTEAALAEMLEARPDAFLVAQRAERVVGFITWGPFRGGPGYARTAEHTIVTAEHGQGIGRALMKAAEERAAGQGIHILVAAISGENPAAQAFHADLGFTLAGRLSQVGRKNDCWLDLILMTKTVDLP